MLVGVECRRYEQAAKRVLLFLNSSYTQKSDELEQIEIKDAAMFDLTPVLTGFAQKKD